MIEGLCVRSHHIDVSAAHVDREGVGRNESVAGHHARLGTRLLVRLCRGRHHRRLNSMRLQGATLIEPDMQICRIRLSDKTSRLHPRRAATKLG